MIQVLQVKEEVQVSNFPPGTFDLTEKPVDLGCVEHLPKVICCSMHLSALHKQLSEGWKQNCPIQDLPEKSISIFISEKTCETKRQMNPCLYCPNNNGVFLCFKHYAFVIYIVQEKHMS